jgi:hypothetical protein
MTSLRLLRREPDRKANQAGGSRELPQRDACTQGSVDKDTIPEPVMEVASAWVVRGSRL